MMLMNYYNTTATWTSNQTYTGTTLTNWWPWNDGLYYTSVSAWKAPEFVVPKWWRWFDVFRAWAKPKLLRLLPGVRSVMLRVQERYPLGQRRKQKRRAYVQALHAL